MFYKCINAVKITILYNKKGFIIQNNKKNLDILKLFLKLRIIKFLKIDNNKISAYINYIENKPVFRNITNLFKPGHKYYISLKNLKKINNNHNWILIISTSQGIMNNFEAEEKKLGGLILAKIWN